MRGEGKPTFGRIAAPKKRILKSATTRRRATGAVSICAQVRCGRPAYYSAYKIRGRDSFPVPSPASEMTCIPPFFFAACFLGWAERDENNVFGEKVNLPLLYLAVNNLARDESIHPSSAFSFFSHPFHLMMILRHAFVTSLPFSSILI